jgi:hypothetical protein
VVEDRLKGEWATAEFLQGCYVAREGEGELRTEVDLVLESYSSAGGEASADQ